MPHWLRPACAGLLLGMYLVYQLIVWLTSTPASVAAG